MEIRIIMLTNESAPTKCLLQCLLDNCFWFTLGFDRDTIIFQLWNLVNLIGERDMPPQGELSNGFLFSNMWTKLQNI